MVVPLRGGLIFHDLFNVHAITLGNFKTIKSVLVLMKHLFESKQS